MTGLAGAQTSYSKIQAMPGWVTQADIWANGQHHPIYKVQQFVASPSLDGSSTEYAILGGSPYSNVLSYKNLGSHAAKRYYTLDYSVWVDKPGNMHTLEVAVNQRSGNRWYKMSTQCNFASKTWRLWNGSTSHWIASGASCPLMKAQSWNHFTLALEIVNGKTHFISATVNGATSYVNIYGTPESRSTLSNALAVHYQIDGNSVEAPFTTYLDQMKLTVQ